MENTSLYLQVILASKYPHLLYKIHKNVLKDASSAFCIIKELSPKAEYNSTFNIPIL